MVGGSKGRGSPLRPGAGDGDVEVGGTGACHAAEELWLEQPCLSRGAAAEASPHRSWRMEMSTFQSLRPWLCHRTCWRWRMTLGRPGRSSVITRVITGGREQGRRGAGPGATEPALEAGKGAEPLQGALPVPPWIRPSGPGLDSASGPLRGCVCGSQPFAGSVIAAGVGK